MAKEMDLQVLGTLITGVVEDTFKEVCHVMFSQEPVRAQKEIIEYDGMMRLFPMEKFNGPAYVAVVNYYVSARHLEAREAVGTLIFYVKEDMVDRLFKAFGRPAAEADDEQKCQDVVGELCGILAEGVKKKLAEQNFIELTLSPPYKYKNVVPEGALFDFNVFRKQEISFSFWKEKCIVVEACFGNIPVQQR